MSLPDPVIMAFFAGTLTAGFLVAALFLLHFWRRSGDRLFLSFSAAFLLLAVNHGLPVVLRRFDEHHPAIYLFRLLAFAIIIAGIWRKNTAR